MRLTKCPFVVLSVVRQEAMTTNYHEASMVVLDVILKHLGSYTSLF